MKEPQHQSTISVCDTDQMTLREGFAAFREAIADAFMPWSFESPQTNQFRACLETFSNDAGSFGQTKISPLVGLRTNVEISRSPEECLYANYVLAGQLHIEQGDRVTSANPGELIIYDSALPLKHTKLGEPRFEDLAFSIPKALIGAEKKRFQNTGVPAHNIIAPLSGCFSYLANPLIALPYDELEAVASACASLLPFAIGWISGDTPALESATATNHYEKALLTFIDDQLDNPELSPRMAAQQLGISTRYVHKRFAALGTTFGNYVRTKRLDGVRKDLLSLADRQPNSELAYRWGFTDVSTFLRAFKRHFGCTPREFRSKE
jgi:AraC family transcriptional regulator, positive regulator of tynA and feaB